MEQGHSEGVINVEDELIWDISPHTEAKHNILRKYIEAWSAILAQGSTHRRLVFIDGFAGPGVYKGGEDGSPIVVLKALRDHKLRPNFKDTEFVNIFIEKRAGRAKNLERVIKERVGSLPDQIKYEVKNAEFNTEMKQILTELESEGKNLAPCLCFVDPFGWSDLNYEILSNIMKYEKAELLITFMAGYLERFVWDPSHLLSIKQLYSDQQIQDIKEKRTEENLVTKFFLENLTRNIKNIGVNAQIYTISFATYNNYNKLEYYLIYITKNCKGLDAMKEAMFGSAKDGSYKFSDFDFNPKQTTLVDYGQEQEWIGRASEDAYQLLVSTFGLGKKIQISNVKDIIKCRSKWVYRKPILVKMEESKKIEVFAENRKKGSYPDKGFISLN